MRIVIAGATGFIGRPLCSTLLRDGHSVAALVRDMGRAAAVLPPTVDLVPWDIGHPEEWRAAVEAADAVVNLAGESLAGHRWTPEVKERIRASRIDTTRALVASIVAAHRPGVALINASATGYYGDRGDDPVTEDSGPGDDFLGLMCAEWEREALAARATAARVVLLRTGIVLGADGGALEHLAKPFRMFVGGPIGSGRQWVPWIHLEDEVGMIRWALAREDLDGPLNCVSPIPSTMAEMAGLIGAVLNRPAAVPVPGLVLKAVLGEFAEALLGGQKVVPAVAERLGYRWEVPDLETALRSILAR